MSTAQHKLSWLLARALERGSDGKPILKAAEGYTLALLLAMEAEGRATITKAALGAIVGVQDRQMTNILKRLEDELTLLQRVRNGGSGKGRGANSYVIRPDATGNEIPVAWGNTQPSSGTQLPVTESNPQPISGTKFPVASNTQSVSGSATGTEVLVACELIDERVYKHADARAQLTLNNYTPELNLQTVELAEAVVAREAPRYLNGSAKGLRAHQLASHLIRIVNSPSLDAHSAGLAKTAGVLRALVDDGADFDTDIVPTVEAMCARQRGKPITSFRFFEGAVRDATATRMALEERAANPITSAEAKSYDQSPSAYRGQSGNGGRALSTSSEILLQKIARGRADEERRMEPHAGK